MLRAVSASVSARSARTAVRLNPRLYSTANANATSADNAAGIKFDVRPESFKQYKPRQLEHFDSPRNYTHLTKEQLISMFRLMNVIRRVELAADQQYKAKQIRGFCHLYSGQEAVIVGMESSLDFKDPFITAYRDHGTQITRGDTAKSVMAELFGKHPGCSQGKGGSMHMYNVNNNFFGGNGIVGAQIPIGTGLAYALKYGKSKPENVSVVCYGDGASNQGQVFESFNMASLWKLPVIYVCENNLYAMGTSTRRGSSNTEYYTRGDTIPGMRVDGMDIFAVREATRFAKSWALEHGPIILEMDTYRYSGHSMSDPGTTYRTREEISDVRQTRDPIEKMKQRLLSQKIFTEEELQAVEQAARDEADEAVQFSKDSPLPPLGDLWKDVYANNVHPVRGITKEPIHPAQP